MKTKRKAVPAHVDRLYKAVQNYVEKHGGKAELATLRATLSERERELAEARKVKEG